MVSSVDKKIEAVRYSLGVLEKRLEGANPRWKSTQMTQKAINSGKFLLTQLEREKQVEEELFAAVKEAP